MIQNTDNEKSGKKSITYCRDSKKAFATKKNAKRARKKKGKEALHVHGNDESWSIVLGLLK